MSDLIRRSDAIKAIDELPNAYNGWSDAYDKAYIIDTLEEVPSADRKGKWIPHPTEREWDVCTVCGIGCKRREIEYDTYFEMTYVTEYGYSYCPNCGAKMKGADDE